MKLRVHEILDAGVIDRTDTLPAADIPLDLPDNPVLLDPVETKIHAEKLEEEVLVWGEVSAKVRLTCSRCLEPYEEEPLGGRFEVRAPARQNFVDVGEEIRQALLLAIPPKPLCRANCKGLCPKCGKNLNQGVCGCPSRPGESPFAKLRDLKIQ
ncbi:MAG TPA: DUF177 domain-containing protein [Elusimicrobiota bacterium]|nr:DUF177 domain-containing protein [Elusimicrobiota bacterium]